MDTCCYCRDTRRTPCPDHRHRVPRARVDRDRTPTARPLSDCMRCMGPIDQYAARRSHGVPTRHWLCGAADDERVRVWRCARFRRQLLRCAEWRRRMLCCKQAVAEQRAQ